MLDVLIAGALAILLGAHGLRKRSLSPSGAGTAFVVGTLVIAGGVRAFGIALMAFYLIGSRATKYGKERKRKLEDGYVDAGYRSGWQVLCNSIWAVIGVTLWNGMHVRGSIHEMLLRMIPGLSSLATSGITYDNKDWCSARDGARWVVYGVLGHFACCLGDTLASELGILARGRPWLVTTFEQVPPGTNGGMSVWGTICSIVGGALIGLVMGATLVVESVCGAGDLAMMVMCGAIAGGVGSFVDSLLGATVQQTRFDGSRITEKSGRVISGYDLLTNNQVNLLASLITALGAAWMTST